MTQIWANYLSNAAKYGGPRPVIEVGAEAASDGRCVRFWVLDHGPGLAPEQLRRVFVPFARVSTVRASGHGLGLSIVRRIAEKLDGRVGAENVPGAGARFWFELPTAAPARPARPDVLFSP